MREPITQEYDYGCGIACFAFALDISYRQAVRLLGQEQAFSDRFWVKDLRLALNTHGLEYTSQHMNAKTAAKVYLEGSIVLIRRSKRYPTGHYLIRYNGKWMDPWINMVKNSDIKRAKSGWRNRLPGQAMYVLYRLALY